MFPWPVPGHEEVSSHYGDRREYNEYKLHLAFNVRAPTGADVVAGAGQIIFADWAGSAGRSVYVDMGAYRVHYCHLSGFNVTRGQTVQAGEIIGWVGGSGNGVDDAYDPHLHLNLFARERPAAGPSHWVAWVGMWAVDPERYLSKEDGMATLEQRVADHEKYHRETIDLNIRQLNDRVELLEKKVKRLEERAASGGIGRGDTVSIKIL